MIDPRAWSDRRVFVTGHTGFKGTWLVHWLSSMGAKVTGYALAPDQTPNLFTLSQAEGLLQRHHVADVRDAALLAGAMREASPEIVIHMAAQPLVRRSYIQPLETWSVNVMGTANVLEAARQTPGIKAIVAVTTDKCYENNGWAWGYREIDALGGHDPYSASKAGSELVVQSYRRSYFSAEGPLLASGRAGNVIGGGDWSEDRLIPDAVRAVAAGRALVIRSPNATRPWQHVLDCLSGYITLGQDLLDGKRSVASAFNFGPSPEGNVPVGQLLEKLRQSWPELTWTVEGAPSGAHEAAVLYLDSAKAAAELKWAPRWGIDEAVKATASWYRAVLANPADAQKLTGSQLVDYMGT